MDVSLFDYDLPQLAIAQTPADRRDGSRLLVVRRNERTWSHHIFSELPDLLPTNCQIFRNAVSVLKARLFGTRSGGGSVECLLLRPAAEANEWWCLLRPGKRLPVGAVFKLESGSATVLAKTVDGEARLRFNLPAGWSVMDLSAQHGVMPLPPYINRTVQDERDEVDNNRYQTVYANPTEQKAVAAPTAGLHFTTELLQILAKQGHSFHDLYLHVGAGTFKPIQVSNIKDHPMHGETYALPAGPRAALHDPEKRPRLAIGTTAMRTIEDYWRKHHGPVPSDNGDYMDEAHLFIYPPNLFHTDCLLTNFHLPKSTLLCLVSAFLTPGSTDGIAWIKELYAEALDRQYRFFSYGDAMLIL